jgi:UDP-glucose/GDP-mannose dehydrogenase family, central domain
MSPRPAADPACAFLCPQRRDVRLGQKVRARQPPATVGWAVQSGLRDSEVRQDGRRVVQLVRDLHVRQVRPTRRFTPGPGVGGHCLPIDPAYLSWQVERARADGSGDGRPTVLAAARTPFAIARAGWEPSRRGGKAQTPRGVAPTDRRPRPVSGPWERAPGDVADLGSPGGRTLPATSPYQ